MTSFFSRPRKKTHREEITHRKERTHRVDPPIIKDEARAATIKLRTGKSIGLDDISIELIDAAWGFQSSKNNNNKKKKTRKKNNPENFSMEQHDTGQIPPDKYGVIFIHLLKTALQNANDNIQPTS